MINWHDYLYYDETSPSGLRRARRTSNRIQVGQVAGVFRKPTGDWKVSVECKPYLAHRIIWEMFNRPLLDWEHVDHINMDRSCNLISNLRVAEPSENNCNRRAQTNNKIGVKGVFWCKQHKKWQAKICMRKTHYDLGRYDTIESAAAAYEEAAHKYHGQFARTV